jgi:hypothetical protein
MQEDLQDVDLLCVYSGTMYSCTVGGLVTIVLRTSCISMIGAAPIWSAM